MGGLRSLDNNFLQKQRENKRQLLSLTQPHTQKKKNPTHKHQAEATEHREKQLKNFKYLENASQSQYQ